MQADIGLIGLAVMGQNLVLNMADHGYTVAVFNRTVSKTDEFLEGPAKGKKNPWRPGFEPVCFLFETPEKDHAHGQGWRSGR